MRFGILSDTHGNTALLHQAAGLLTEQQDAGTLVHLGDNYEDALELDAYGLPVLKVPGLYCDAYHDDVVPNHLAHKAGSWRLLFAHSEATLPETAFVRADVIAVGHTHQAGVRHTPAAVVLNPGHLAKPYGRGRYASYGLLVLGERDAAFEVFGLSGERMLHEKFDKA
jgi:putative phosphoesterase